MSLFARLLQAVRSWRRRRGGPKTVRYAGIAMEQLDHRQLLSVNFTGNVPIDFPATQVPGVVVLPDNPSVQHPTIAPAIAPIVKVSGFDISGIRVSYSPSDDTLSIGLDQPQSLNHPGEVIASDSDNNGNSGTVNPAVTAIPDSQRLWIRLTGAEPSPWGRSSTSRAAASPRSWPASRPCLRLPPRPTPPAPEAL